VFICFGLYVNWIGNAKVAGLEKDIGLTPQEYSWALSIFFIGYMVDFVVCLFEN